MANYCTNCGHELREGEKFCAECGTPVGGHAPQNESVQWEYCGIQFKTNKIFLSHSSYFYAEAVGPYGPVEIGRTEEFPPNGKYESGEKRWSPSEYGLGLLNDLVAKLTSVGWERLPEKGPYGWNYKFRREVVTEHPRPTSLVPPPTGQFELMKQMVETQVTKGDAAAMLVIESYLAAATPRSLDYIDGLWMKSYLLKGMKQPLESMAVGNQALQIIEEALRADPSNSSWWNKKMHVLRTMGRTAEAREAERMTKQLERGR